MSSLLLLSLLAVSSAHGHWKICFSSARSANYDRESKSTRTYMESAGVLATVSPSCLRNLRNDDCRKDQRSQKLQTSR